MESTASWAIVGIGKLGNAILNQFENNQLESKVYHPDTKKAKEVAEIYSYTDVLQKEDLNSLDYIILALPADNIVSFIEECQSIGMDLQRPILINMATSLSTKRLKEEFPDITWASMKFVGHAESLKKYRDGLFVTEENVLENSDFQEIVQRFSKLGQLIADEESIVEKINKLATYHAIKAAREVELEMSKEGYKDVYKKQALRSVLPEVIRAYSKGKLGHFAEQIAQNLDEHDKGER